MLGVCVLLIVFSYIIVWLIFEKIVFFGMEFYIVVELSNLAVLPVS